jgi:hypothetical protein
LTKISWQMERMGLNKAMGVPARFVGTPLCASRKSRSEIPLRAHPARIF